MTFRIFAPIEALNNIIVSLILFTSMTLSTHFSATSTPTPANPSLPSRRTCIACPPHQAICYPHLSTLFPVNSKNPDTLYPPYQPPLHPFPTSSRHSMKLPSTGNPVDYQAFCAHHKLGCEMVQHQRHPVAATSTHPDPRCHRVPHFEF